MRPLYHLVAAAEWAAAQASGRYAPSSLQSEGFIHFSWDHQWRLSLQRYYRGQEGLLRLRIDPTQLTAELRIEQGFPHLYGPLECSAVLEVVPLAPVRDLKVGLLSALRPGREALAEAAAQDCRLVVLPELPFHRWFPALAEVDRHDQDPSCLEAQADLARASGLWLLGGNLEDRRNAAYLWDPQGQVRLRYEKLHLPHEPGFWEDHHYDPGSQPPRVFDGLGFPLGVQICSDIQRPFGSMFLRHQGASAILVPRATESSTYARWRLVMQAMARVTACYVLSVNRPGPELGVALGGPSLAVGPDGEVLAESQDPLLCVTLEHAAVVRARGQYPGYLAVAHEVYAAAWSESLHFGNP